MDSCCAPPTPVPDHDHCLLDSKKIDWIFLVSLVVLSVGYFGYLLNFPAHEKFQFFAASEFELMNKMWLGLGLGILFVGILTKIPQQFILSILGQPYTFGGILRATMAGLLLDMCSHGI